MASHSEKEPDSVRLSHDSAADLLRRATQLDAANADKVTVAELRQAAMDAGIAPEAFEQALSELHTEEAAATKVKPVENRRQWSMTTLALAAALAGLVVIVLSRLLP
jgi:hypothetical protein